jgi:acyl dehydratase
MAVHLHRVGAESEPERFQWSPRDCSLYALAIGAGIDDVAYTTEGNVGVPQRVYPTFAFAVVAALSSRWPDPCFATGDFPLERVVLGEQGLVIHQPLAPRGDVTVRTRVAGIHDKGSAALIVLDQQAVDTATGVPVFTSTVDLFVSGEGGFGGPPRPATDRQPMPERPRDLEHADRALPVQTLLYRHGGNDANPAHVDPAFAARAGWPGPILTGQNTLGFACRAVVRTLASDDPSRLQSVGARFVAPAFNGDELRTEMWLDRSLGESGLVESTEMRVRFRVRNQRGEIVIDRGLARLD